MDAHAREAAAAEAAIAEFYGTVRRLAPGDLVWCEPPFVGDQAIGEVLELDGDCLTLLVNGERLAYRSDEVEYAGPRAAGGGR